MKVIFLIIWVVLNTFLPLHSQGFIIDHNSIQKFDQIPDQYLEAARNTRLMFSDRSVGQNIHEALDYFQAESWEKTPASARRDYIDTLWNTKLFSKADWDAGLVPERIRFNPDPVKYNRSKWIFVYRQDDWNGLTKDFIESLGPMYLDSADVLTYQFSYLNVMEGDDIADPVKGFFANVTNRYDVYDLEKFLQLHPDKKFFYWTTSLARGIGTKSATDFNIKMRAYCAKNNKVLFDMADIISHTDKGIPCYDNRDGIPYKTENYVDDGFNYPAICQDYTTEIDGGHLGSVSGGKVIIAKAFWVLMAKLAGWNDAPTNTHVLKETRFDIYPNPANQLLNVHFDKDWTLDDLKVFIHDITAREQFAKHIIASKDNTISLQINNLNPGIYLLTLQTSEFTKTIKFIVGE